jgi:hypothetical protein
VARTQYVVTFWPGDARVVEQTRWARNAKTSGEQNSASKRTAPILGTAGTGLDDSRYCDTGEMRYTCNLWQNDTNCDGTSALELLYC